MSKTSAESRKKLYWKDREKILLQQKASYQRHKETRKARQREYTVRVGSRSLMLRKKYGLTEADYATKLVSQNGVCAICHQPETAKRKGKPLPLVVDHDHKTGKVRSLLCSKCNAAIGMLCENPLHAIAAARYLESFIGG